MALSFEESKKKLMQQAATPMTLSLRHEPIVAYSNDSWTRHTGYRWFEDYYDDKISHINEIKDIAVHESQVNISQEVNSQFIPFEMNRYYDNIDLVDMVISVHYTTSDKYHGSSQAVNVEYNDEKIRFSWLVDENATHISGAMQFEVHADGAIYDSEGNSYGYRWKTKSTDKFNILESLCEGQDHESVVVTDDWVVDIVTAVAESVGGKIADAQIGAQVVAAENAANRAEASATNAQNAVQAELGHYYTKTEIDNKIQNVDLTGYATEQYVQDEIEKVDVSDQLPKNLSDLAEDETHRVVTDAEKQTWNAKSEFSGNYGDLTGTPTKVSNFENDSGYLTEHQDLSAYALKLDIPSIDGLATEKYVDDAVAAVDVSEQLQDYAKSEDVYTKTEVDEKVANVSVDLTGYATETYVTSKTDVLSASVTTNAAGISSLSAAVIDLQKTVSTVDTSPRKTYDLVYNNLEDENSGENVLVFYEIENENTDNEIKTVKQKYTITGGNGGVDSSNTLYLYYDTNENGENITQYAFTIDNVKNKEAIIYYDFVGTDAVGDSISYANATWQIRRGSLGAWSTIKTETIYPNANIPFNVSEYIPSAGTYSLKLSVTDDTNAYASKTWSIQQIDLKIESEFNDSFTYPLGTVEFDYTPYGAISKDIHFILDGKEIDTVTTSASGIPMGYTLPEQRHGAHLLEVYITAEMSNNTIIESNHIFKDIIWYDSASTEPVISTIYQDFTARQYDATNIKYTVYDPATETPTVTIAIDGDVVSTPTLNEATNTYSYKTADVGDHIITITCGDTFKTLKAHITKLDINASPVIAGLAFDFNPSGKSNNDIDRVWSNGTVSMSVSDNFDWVNGGYQYDDNGDQYFCIKAGTSAEIDYQLFADDAKKNGKEMKLVFKTTNVQEANAQFMSCVDNTTGSDHIGIEMFAHEAYIYGSAKKLHLKYSENDIIEFEFNITKNTEAVSEICGYEDGVATRHLVYDDSFGFTQVNPKVITLGSDKCDLHIYRLKVYNTSLTDRGILNNFIADARNAEEMINRYNRNQIYDENQNLTPETLAEKCPWLRIFVVSAPYFTNKKSDKVPYTTIKQIYKNGDPVLDNWTCYDCMHSGQGTSSDNYGASARNLDFIMNKSGRDGVNPYFVLGDGTTQAQTVSLTRTSIPNAYFNFKANVASSNHFTNALLAKRFYEFNPYIRPFVREDASIIDYIKDTMEFHNAVVFIQETDTDLSTHREFADNLVHFYSIGNIGDSKKTDDTRLNDISDRYECVNEICDIKLPLSDWPNTPEAITALEAEKFDKSGSYEWRYIWEDGTDEENAEVREYCKQKWIDMYKFVVQSTDEEFKAHLGDYFVLDSVLYYYLFTTRYCMVDNRAKNSFWHYGKTGEVDADGNPIRKWDLNWGYDFDSSMSLNNYGNSVYRHGYEDTDTMDGTGEEVFRESDSTFFCRVRDNFKDELKEMYNTLESKNAWHSESFLNEIEAWQKQFPEELWRLDCQRKYIRTVNESFISGKGDPQYITNMAQGRMLYPVKQWERSQGVYMASKYQSSAATSDNVVLRCTVPTGDLVVPVNYKLKLTPYDYIYLNVMYGTQERIQMRALPGVQYEIPFEGDSVDIIDISSASALQDLGDLSSTYPATVDTAKAIRLKELHIGNSTEGYDNPSLTTMTLGANYLLEVLNVENVSGLTQPLDLSILNNLREVYAHGTNTGGITFADGGKIEIAELPAINTISMKNLVYLTTLDIADLSKLTTLTAENCNTVDLLTIFNSANNLNRVRITGIDWSLEDTTLLERIYKMYGKDKNGYNIAQSVLSGKVHVPVIKQKQLENYSLAWQDLEISYNTLVEQYAVTFINPDNTILDVQYVDKGTKPVDPIARLENPIATPTLESTISTDYTFAGWDKTFTDVFADTVIYATYTETVRVYSVKYVSHNNVLQETQAEYGTIVTYEGEIPTYTAEESAYKYYLFDTWDKGGYVNGDKTINAVYDSCVYTEGCFSGKKLADMRPVEIYMMTKLAALRVIDLKSYIGPKDAITISLGNDVSYADIEEQVLIGEKTVFNGSNYVDTGIQLLSEDRDFVLAIDFKMHSGNSNNAVLAQCFSGYDASGFKLMYNSGVRLAWGGASDSPCSVDNREMLVIRHIKGEYGLHVYVSDVNGTSLNYVELSGSRTMTHNVSLIFGCEKLEDGTYQKYATGTIYWSKVWYADLGDTICRQLACWPHEEFKFEACLETDGSLKRYYLSDGSRNFSSVTFIAANALSKPMKLDTSGSNSGGWATYDLNAYLNNRLYPAFSSKWKQLMKQVQVRSSIGNSSTDTSISDCHIFIPAIAELYQKATSEPYPSEGTLISHMTTPASRICYTFDGDAVSYWTRSPTMGHGAYVYRIDANGNPQQITNVSGADVYTRIMISI